MRLYSLALAALLAACTAMPSGQPQDGRTVIQEVTVGPDRVDCMGVAPMRCLVVDGEYFYDPIEGFEHEAGTTYRLRIERTQVFDADTAPADASLYAYRLIDVLDARP